MTERIKHALDFLNETYEISEFWKINPVAKAYRFDHTIRVAKYAKIVAESENLDSEALQIAAILHDISYGLDFDISKSKYYKEPCPELDGLSHEDLVMHHGYISALHSWPFVESLGFDEETKNQILYAIGTHIQYPKNSKLIGQETLFTKSLCNCDEIDHVSAFRLYEDIEKFKFTDRTQEERQQFCWNVKGHTQHQMEHLYQDMRTETAKKIFKENCDFRFSVLENLQSIIDASKPENL